MYGQIIERRQADGRTDPPSYEPSALVMSKCPTRETTKEVSDQTLLDNQILQELLVGNRHDTKGKGCSIC